tara:strand:+ start:2259 stop:2723 length:465 start_codon:yes stop_codon:yes gene_type:complete
MTNQSKRGVLLASFMRTHSDEEVLVEVQAIADSMHLTNQMIFLLEDEESPDRKILTYNVEARPGQLSNPRLFTLRIHRKKHTNTLYTINALNLAIASENNGQTGRHLKLDWEKYSNSALLATNKELRVVPLKLLKIFKVEEPEVPEEDQINKKA